MKTTPRILVVGSCVMDLIVGTERFPQSGETVIGHSFSTAPGGKGANQAVQAAKLGAEVTMVGKVGNDGFGKDLIESLKESGVSVKYVMRTDEAPSAVGNVQLETAAEHTVNRICVVPGANMKIKVEDVAFLKNEISKYDLVILQLEIPMEINCEVARYAYSANVPVMLNSAPFTQIPEELLKCLAYISPNEHEAALMTGIKIGSIQEAETAADIINKMGIENVLITLGSAGAVMKNRDVFIHSPCVDDINAADPTAAGDSFVAAFCVAVCAGLKPKDALMFSNYTAALTVSRIGAQPSLPTINELKALMEKHGAIGKDLKDLLF